MAALFVFKDVRFGQGFDLDDMSFVNGKEISILFKRCQAMAL